MAGDAIGQDLLNVPMGDLIRQMAFAIADAQFQLDIASLRVAEVMSGKRVQLDADGKPMKDASGNIKTDDTRVYFGGDKKNEPEELSLIELGFAPTFYQFIDTLIEVKIAINITRSAESNVRFTTADYRSSSTAGFSRDYLSYNSGYSVSCSTVDAAYASKYNYSAEGASVLRTKLVPVPPPSILNERVRRLLEKGQP
jgi:hypothetical protein